jgi:HAD superfamily hydrolase (TIGR01509 family)
MIRAIIFDFDGLIIETERPSYQSWQEVYLSFGQPLPFSTWSVIIGTTRGGFNPRLELERLVGSEVDWEVVEPRRRASENALIEAQPILPGVEAYLRASKHMGLKTGLASNSSRRWVIGHLTRIGLVDYFEYICTADDVERLKPDPESYQSVLHGLGVEADEAIALEDSPIGISAAKAAGLYSVAVPNEMTRQLSLVQADFRLESLAEIPLATLLDKINSLKTQGAAL